MQHYSVLLMAANFRKISNKALDENIELTAIVSDVQWYESMMEVYHTPGLPRGLDLVF